MLTTLTTADGRGFLDPSAASLARELALDIRPVEAILPDYGFTGLTDPLWLELAESPDFRRLLAEAQREWNAADTTKRRIQLKAQASVEMALTDIHNMIVGENVDHADRINAAKVMKSLAGLDTPPNGAAMDAGGGFSVKIVIGDQQVVKSISAAPTIEHEPDSTQVRESEHAA